MKNLQKWYLSISVLGLGGLAALVISPVGRQVVRRAVQRLRSAPEELNDSTQRELDRLQEALDRLAASMQTVR